MNISIVLVLSGLCGVWAKSNILPKPEFDPYDDPKKKYARKNEILPGGLYNFPYNYSMGNDISMQVLWQQVIAISGPAGHICAAVLYTRIYEDFVHNRTVLISAMNPLRKYLKNFDLLEVTWAYGDGMEPPGLYRARVVNLTRFYPPEYTGPVDLDLGGLLLTHDLAFIQLDRPMLPSNNNVSLEVLRITNETVKWEDSFAFAISGLGYACAEHLFHYLGTMERHWYKISPLCLPKPSPCEDILPNNWGYFICVNVSLCYNDSDSIYFKTDYILGCEAGSPLVLNTKYGFLVQGICSFSMYIDSFLILVYTDIKQYLTVFEERFGWNKTNINILKTTTGKHTRTQTHIQTTTPVS